MRTLKTTDVFGAMRVIKAAGVKDEIKRIAFEWDNKKNITEDDQREVGAELIFSIIDGLADKKSESLMYEFLAGPFEMQPEEIGNLDLKELIDKIKELGKLESPEGWKAFFKSLGDLIK